MFRKSGSRKELRPFILMTLQIYTSVARHFNSFTRNLLCSPPPVVNYNAIVRCVVDVFYKFLSSNIPSLPAYGVFISQLIRYARACSSYECFILRAMRLSNKLLGQGYVKERLKSSLRKFYGRYGDLTKQYEVSLSRMLHDILDDDHIQWHPPLIGHYTNF